VLDAKKDTLARPRADVLQPVVEALTMGVTSTEENRVLSEAVDNQSPETNDVDREEAKTRIRDAALVDLIAESNLRTGLLALEEWLDGETNAGAAMSLATVWGMRATGLDLESAAGDAKLYIDSYPPENRIIGDLDERCARWLAQRITLVQAGPDACLPSVRRSILTLAEATAPEFPQVAASVRLVSEQTPDEQLWYELALRITQRELATTI
jgi:hypothetical protein